MINEVGMLGIGLCGGNLVSCFEEWEYKTLYINTSKEDLDSLKIKENVIHIQGSEGAHKDRNVAKKLILEHIEEIIGQVVDTFKDRKYIFIFSSLGGGTGSGLIAAFAQILSGTYGKIVLPVVVLPKDTESVVALKNAYQCLSELENVKTGATFILDNKTKDDITEINTKFADQLHALLSPKQVSAKGNMDKSELKFMLESKGFSMIIYLKNKAILPSIKKALDSSIYAPLEDDMVVKYIGITQSTNYDIVGTLTKEIGRPLDVFQGYDCEDTVIFLNGLTLPVTRMNEIMSSINNEKDNVSKMLTSLNTKKLEANNLDFFDDMINEKQEDVIIENKKGGLRELLMNL